MTKTNIGTIGALILDAVLAMPSNGGRYGSVTKRAEALKFYALRSYYRLQRSMKA